MSLLGLENNSYLSLALFRHILLLFNLTSAILEVRLKGVRGSIPAPNFTNACRQLTAMMKSAMMKS